MALLFMGTEDACPTTSGGANDLLSAPTRGFMGVLSSASSASEFFLSATTVTQDILSGDLSERKLRLSFYRTAGSPSSSYRGASSVYIQTPGSGVYTIAAALRINPTTTYSLSETPRPLFGINDGLQLVPGSSQTTLTAFSPYCVMAREDGKISVGSSVSAAGVLNGSTYRHVEAVFDTSDGSVDVYVDDVLVVSGTLSFTSVDTIGVLAGGGWDGASGGPGGGANWYTLDIDNLIILDDTGSSFNTRLGPRSVQRIPLSAESSVTFSAVGAVDNITAVNKQNLDTDSYVRSPQADNQADLYTVDSSVIDDTKDIDAVILAPYFRKTDIGARDLAGVATDGSTTLSQTFTDADTDFKGSSTPLVMPLAPDGGAWTKTKIGDCEFGYKVLA